MHPFINAAIAAIALALPSFSVTATAQERFTVAVSGPENAPDVILIPGLASSRGVWDATEKQLAPTHRLHVIQVRGFAGEPSGANAYGAVLKPLIDEIAAYAEALDKPALIGHSVGGLISLEVAAMKPDAVSRVMVVDALPFYSLLFNPAATVELSAPYAEMNRTQLLAMNDEQFARVQGQTMAMMTMNAAARPAVLDWTLTSDRRVVAQVMYEVTLDDARPRLPAINTPVTVLHAWDQSMRQGSEAADGMYASAYAALPAASLQRVDGSYHFIMLDQPDVFAGKVADFLR